MLDQKYTHIILFFGLSSSISASPVVAADSEVLARSADNAEFKYTPDYVKNLENGPLVTEVWNKTAINIVELGNGTSLNKRQWTSGWDCHIWAGWGKSPYFA